MYLRHPNDFSLQFEPFITQFIITYHITKCTFRPILYKKKKKTVLI